MKPLPHRLTIHLPQGDYPLFIMRKAPLLPVRQQGNLDNFVSLGADVINSRTDTYKELRVNIFTMPAMSDSVFSILIYNM